MRIATLVKRSIKLLAIDIDGTLVGEDGVISAEDKAAITEAVRLGIKVALCTGRAIQSCYRVLGDLGLDGYHIFCDGALVYSPSRCHEVYSQTIPPEVLQRMVAFARSQEMNLDLYTVGDYFVERETWSARVHRDIFGIPPTIGSFDHLPEPERIVKAGLVARTPEEQAKAERFNKEFASDLYFSWVTTPSYPQASFVNVVAPGVSKGRAIKALAEHLGLVLSEVMAIGDGNNDISLLSTVGLGVAMGNATEELKAVAHHVTLKVEQGGVAAAVREFLL
jgi:Cof subfamily protein (haloacid dehalogenase superfamily)